MNQIKKKIIIFCLFLVSNTLYVQVVSAKDNLESEIVDEIEVFADDLRYEIELDRLQSANILGVEAIQRVQSSDVYDLLSSMPGVEIQGGITTGGKSFSIRGFGDNEDVLVQIDGVTQNFEKYRAGTGVEIEPELLKEIAVFRGGTSVAQGAGYLGGVVQMETKDARDFLEDDRVGGTIRWGWKNNNDEQFRSYTFYALPVDGIDVLINQVSRLTNDLTQPNGESFDNSDEQQESLLAKIEKYTVDSILSYSFRNSKDEGIEPFDLVSNCNSASISDTLCRDMFRDTKENAHSFRGQYNPESSIVDLDFVVGYIDKSVTEQTSIGNGFVKDDPVESIQHFEYDIWNFNLKNISEFDFQNLSSRWTYGFQATSEKRISKKELQGEFEEYKPQPSGLKVTKAVYLDSVFELDEWRLQFGLRHDRYAVSSEDDEVMAFTIERFGDKKIEFSKTTPSFNVDYTFKDHTVFYRYSEAFRAPLVSQYFSPSSNFSSDATGTCAGFSEVLVQPSRDDFPGGLTGLMQFNTALSEYENAPDSLKYANFFCGDVYVPEESKTSEVGILSEWFVMSNEMGGLQTKLTYFEIKRFNKLNSLFQDPQTLLVSQPNKEERHGYEAEINYLGMNGFMVSLGYSNLRGVREELIDGVYYAADLRAPPGDSLNLHISSGLDHFNLNGRVGLLIRGVKSRLVDQNQDARLSIEDANFLSIPGYSVYDVYSSIKVDNQWSFKFSINNLFNREYQLRGFGGGIGNVSMGRDVRASFECKL